MINSSLRIHKGNEAELFWCLHKNIDPYIVSKIMDAKFPGILARFTVWIEDCTGKTFLTWMKNKVIAMPRLSKAISILARIIALESKYIDQFKDTALAVWILGLVGGFQSVIHNVTNFSSVVVITMFCSVLVPLMLSSIHLAVNNPWMIWRTRNRGSERLCINILTFFCFWLNPILLTNKLENAKEAIIYFGEHFDYGVVRSMERYREIKLQLVEFLRIELSKLN